MKFRVDVFAGLAVKVWEEPELEWRVELTDYDGGVEVAIFSGPNAEDRALRYIAQEYTSLQIDKQ